MEGAWISYFSMCGVFNMAPDTVLFHIFTQQTLAIINSICLSPPPALFLSSTPLIPPKNLQFGLFLRFRFRRQYKLLQPAAKNY